MTYQPMSIDDIADLLAQCAARDQRTVGRADALAWWQDLNRACITKPDAEAAISRYYAVEWPRQDPAQRFRVTAPVIIEMVNKARAARLEGFVYQPPDPTETGAQYIARRREQITAVANGQAPEDLAAPAIMRPRPVAALVKGVADARKLPPEIAEILDRRRPRALEVPCPWEPCHARAGQACTNQRAQERDPHPSRVDAWATVTADCPACRTPPGEPCRVPGTATTYPHGAHAERLAAAKEMP
jgi:hypothetical protein